VNLGQIVGACESFVDGALIFSGHQVPLMRLFIGVAAERRAVPLPRRTSAGLAIYEPGIQSGIMSPPRAGAEDADGVFVIERDSPRLRPACSGAVLTFCGFMHGEAIGVVVSAASRPPMWWRPGFLRLASTAPRPSRTRRCRSRAPAERYGEG
jgi:hypothetical protein